MQKDKNTYQNFLTLPLISKLNNLAKAYSIQPTSYNTCEICYKTLNLISCNVCKNYYHPECLNMTTKPANFICPKCKERIPNANKIFNENSKSSSDNLYDDVSTNFPFNHTNHKSKRRYLKYASNSPKSGVNESISNNYEYSNSKEYDHLDSGINNGTNKNTNSPKIKFETETTSLLGRKKKKEKRVGKRKKEAATEQKNANDNYKPDNTATQTSQAMKRKSAAKNIVVCLDDHLHFEQPNLTKKEREERMVDALAQGGYEGRGKLR